MISSVIRQIEEAADVLLQTKQDIHAGKGTSGVVFFFFFSNV